MKIGLDFNGVVKDSIGLKRRTLQERFGIDTSPESCRKNALLEAGFTQNQYRELNRLIYDTPLALEANPVSGSLEAIARLSTAHEIILVTGLFASGQAFGRQWLDSCGLCDLELICVGKNESKAHAVQGCAAYVDDDMPRLLEVGAVVPHTYYLGPSFRYQADVSIAGFDNWEDLETELHQVAGLQLAL